MIVSKITNGYVIQDYDTDTKQWVEQTFTAGDLVEYEIDGYGINYEDFLKTVGYDEPYLPFDMVQPQSDQHTVTESQARYCGKLIDNPTSCRTKEELHSVLNTLTVMLAFLEHRDGAEWSTFRRCLRLDKILVSNQLRARERE